jgi:hypothetical protein
MIEIQQAVDVVVLKSGTRMKGTVRHLDDVSIVVTVPGGKPETLVVGAQILILSSQDSGILAMQTSVGATRDNSFQAPRSAPTFIQRRKQMRIPCNLKATYRERIADSRQRTGHACDISTGGVRIVVLEEGLPGTELDVTIELAPGEILQATTTVTRCVRRSPSLWQQPNLREWELAMKFNQVSRLGQIQLARFLQMFIPQG